MRLRLLACVLLLLPLAASSLTAQATFTVNLGQAGYNAVAFQHLTLTAVNASSAVVGVFFWDGTAYQARNLTPQDINAAGTMRGYWVFANSPTSFTYSGNDDSGNRTTSLTAGWNLVGFPSATDVSASTLVVRRNGTQVPLGSALLPTFQEIGSNNAYTPVDVQASGAVLKAGRPYWVFAGEAGLTLSYGAPAPTPSPSASPTPTPSGQMYITSGRQIKRYFNAVTTANGTLVPAATMDLSAAVQVNTVEGLFVDQTNNRLYAGTGNSVVSCVAVIDNATQQTGNITPARLIRCPNFASPSRVAVDVARNKLYVGDPIANTVWVFDNASAVDGIAPFNRTIGMPGLRDILLDAANDRLYISYQNSINVYNNASTSNTTQPSRTLAGAQTRLTAAGAMAFDDANNLIVTEGAAGELLVFASKDTLNGDVAPKAIVSQPGRSLPLQLAFASGSLFVPAFTQGTVNVYPNPGAFAGNVTPVPSRVMVPPDANTIGLAVDPTR